MLKCSSGCKLIYYELLFLMNSALKFQYLISMRIFNWYPLTLQRIPTLRLTASQVSACGILNCFTRSPASRDAKLLSPSLSLRCLLLLFSFASTENLLPSLILSCASFHHLLFHTLAAAKRSLNRPSSCAHQLSSAPIYIFASFFLLPGEQQFLPAVENHDHGEGSQCTVESGSTARPGTDELFSHLSLPWHINISVNLCHPALVGQHWLIFACSAAVTFSHRACCCRRGGLFAMFVCTRSQLKLITGALQPVHHDWVF